MKSTAIRLLVLLLPATLAGCQAPGGSPAPAPSKPAEPFFGRTTPQDRKNRQQDAQYIDASEVDSRDDIVFVNNYWQPQPWIVDSFGRVIGLSARSYFVSSETERGVFVNGDILVWINLIETDGFGRSARARLAEQRFAPADALGMRIRKRSLLGYSYGTIITFPEGATLGGRQIEVQIGYETLDGRIVRSTPRRFQVPVGSGGDALPPEPSAPADAPQSARRPARAAPSAPAAPETE